MELNQIVCRHQTAQPFRALPSESGVSPLEPETETNWFRHHAPVVYNKKTVKYAWYKYTRASREILVLLHSQSNSLPSSASHWERLESNCRKHNRHHAVLPRQPGEPAAEPGTTWFLRHYDVVFCFFLRLWSYALNGIYIYIIYIYRQALIGLSSYMIRRGFECFSRSPR